jgi:hypothetical protein
VVPDLDRWCDHENAMVGARYRIPCHGIDMVSTLQSNSR